MVHDLSILRAKLFLPPPRPNLISRPHLIQRLGENRTGNVTVLSAPAGFGKTTLLAEWMRGGGAPVAWLSLDEGDNDPIRFWRYVLAALQTIRPEIGESIVPMLASQKVSAPESEALVTALLNDITAVFAADAPVAVAPLTLVLDDYHLIRSSVIHQGMSFLLRHQPPQLRVVLLTRTDPPLPLARLRVQGRLLELRAADLRFTRPEIETFFNQIMALELSPEVIVTLANRTEGWATGLQLAALSLQGLEATAKVHFVETFAGTHQHVLSYLMEEVWQRQPPAVQQFLLHTAVLRRLTAPLCAAVTGQPEAGNILIQLARQNLFVVPLDEAGQWYRYHPLFAEALVQRLQETEPGLVSELHRRASGWCAGNGLREKAIAHALAAEDLDTAASLIEQAAEETWSQGDLTTLLVWLDALPAAYLAQRPHLCLDHAWVLFLHDQWTAATERWQLAAEQIERLPDPERIHLRGVWAAIGGAMAATQQDAARTLTLAQEALSCLPAEDNTWHEVTTINLGLAYLWRGEAAKARDTFEEAVDLCRRQGNTYLTFAALWHMAEACLSCGRLDEAGLVYEQLGRLEGSKAGRRLHLRANSEVGLAGLAYEHNDLETAEQLLTGALAQLWPGGQPRVVVYGRIMLARLYQAQGNRDGAQAQLQQAADVVQQMNMVAEGQLLAGWQAQLALAAGDDAAVRRWQRTGGIAPEDTPDFRREVGYLALARLLLAQGCYQEAQGLLTRHQAAAERDGRRGSLVEILILQALLWQRQGQREAALAIVERALLLAEPEGYIRTFIDAGPEVATLLRECARRGPTVAYAGRLLRAFQASVQPADKDKIAATADGRLQLLESLTEREQEILQLIARGCTNQDVADELVLTVGTVKGHVNHILSKLDAHNRTEAVAHARRLGLLG